MKTRIPKIMSNQKMMTKLYFMSRCVVTTICRLLCKDFFLQCYKLLLIDDERQLNNVKLAKLYLTYRFRLHSNCTIFCKRVNARAEICHTNPLQCSDCKNILQSEHSKGCMVDFCTSVYALTNDCAM